MKRERLSVPIVLTDDEGSEAVASSSIFIDNILFIWKDIEGRGVLRLLNGEDILTSLKFEVLNILLDTATKI